MGILRKILKKIYPYNNIIRIDPFYSNSRVEPVVCLVFFFPRITRYISTYNFLFFFSRSRQKTVVGPTDLPGPNTNRNEKPIPSSGVIVNEHCYAV